MVAGGAHARHGARRATAFALWLTSRPTFPAPPSTGVNYGFKDPAEVLFFSGYDEPAPDFGF
jgi:hypothetical protein